MSAREALRHSRNVPTVRLAQEIGTDAVAEFAEEAGVEADIPRGPSMALGTVALSPMALARAYATFAGLGRSAEPRLIRKVETVEGRLLWETETRGEDRIDPAVAYVLNDMLQDVIDGGTGSGARAAGFRSPAAGKTGTTQEAADVWFVGYTPELVGVVWMGFDRPAPILPDATGGALAAPVWGRMMARGGRSGSDWERPDGVVSMAYDPATGRPLARDCAFAGGAPAELFIEGRGVSASCPAARGPLAGDSLGRPSGDSLFGDSLGLGRDSIRADTPGRIDTAGPDTIRPDTIGRDTTPPDTTRRRPDTVRPDTNRRDTARRASPDTTRRAPPDTTGG